MSARRLSDRFGDLLERLGALQVRWPLVPLGIAALLTVVGALLATRLELRTRFDQLLPDNQPSAVEYRRVLARTETSSNVFVVLEGDDSAKLRAFGDALVPKLQAEGKPFVTNAGDGVQAQRAFLSPRAGLFASKDELVKLRDDIEARWSYEVAKDLDQILDDDAPVPPPIDPETVKKRFRRDGDDGDARFPDGYYQSKDGKALVVIAHTSVPGGELGRAGEALARVKEIVGRVHDDDAYRGVRVGYAGDLVTGLAEYGAMKDDLVSVGAIGLALVLGVVLLFFMRLRALVAMGVTILAGLSWTFGLTELAIGHLNVATGFLFSIVAGNGINFGIIYLARYFEERRNGAGVEAAVGVAHRATWPATLTAALSAAAAYGSLGVTDFRAFKHFAFIGAAGMLVCWIATYAIMPAVLVLVERVRPFAGSSRTWLSRIRLRGIRYDAPFAFLVPKAPRAIAAVGVLVAIAAVAIGVRYVRADPMEYDMRKLQNDMGTSGEMYRLSAVAADILGAKLESAMVVLADRPDQVLALKKVLEARRDAAPADEKPFEAVHTIFDFVPEDQAGKLPVLEEIRAKIVRAHERGRIQEADWPEIARVLPPEDLQPFTADDLPDEVARPFTDKEGTRGLLALIEPTAGKNDSDLRYLLRWADSFRETTLSNGEKILGSGRAVIFADMLTAVETDMPRAIALSLGMTVLAVIVTFRRGASSFAVLFALSLGLLWLVVAVAAAALKINFFNFIAFPITFGIGVDYAVNFVQRYTADPRRDILRVLRSTGGAVILCSLTTILGYLALIGSINQAIRSLGMVAVLGEVCCLLAAVLVLPAVLLWRERAAAGRGSLAGATLTGSSPESPSRP